MSVINVVTILFNATGPDCPGGVNGTLKLL